MPTYSHFQKALSSRSMYPAPMPHGGASQSPAPQGSTQGPEAPSTPVIPSSWFQSGGVQPDLSQSENGQAQDKKSPSLLGFWKRG